MATKLVQQVESQDLAMRRLFADAICGEGYQETAITAEVFHETLALAHKRNWVHPTQLARRLAPLSASNVRKWFLVDPKKRSTPNSIAMARALQELAALMEVDIGLVTEGKPTVGDTVWKPEGATTPSSSRLPEDPVHQFA